MTIKENEFMDFWELSKVKISILTEKELQIFESQILFACKNAGLDVSQYTLITSLIRQVLDRD